MATGTGKTLVAFQIVWKLWKTRRKTRILLGKQAVRVTCGARSAALYLMPKKYNDQRAGDDDRQSI
jgi:hypothetical protein